MPSPTPCTRSTRRSPTPASSCRSTTRLLARCWQIFPETSVAEYRDTPPPIDALNHALRDLPEEQVRYTLCWGSWHGPHKSRHPAARHRRHHPQDQGRGLLVEAANPRHEHEWRLWQDAKLPDGKLLIPGVVGHETNFIEHPELVAERLARYAGLVGAENVIAGTDCGMGGRIDADLAWAKIGSLVAGARHRERALSNLLLDRPEHRAQRRPDHRRLVLGRDRHQRGQRRARQVAREFGPGARRVAVAARGDDRLVLSDLRPTSPAARSLRYTRR